MGASLDFAIVRDSLPAMLHGLLTTTLLALAVAVIGLFLAVPMALARMSAHRYLAWPVWLFVAFFRGAPLLLVLYLVYYGLGQIAALHHGAAWLILGSPIACAVLGLTLNHVAYMVDVVRGSLNAVPAGIVEAAAALGISSRDALVRIRLPLALRFGLEAYQNEIVGFTKGTAVVSVITVVDLTAVANEVFQRTYDPLTPMLTAAFFYWILVSLIRLGFRRLRASLNRHIPIAGELGR
jgi:arginine/ornithine transport system permease protein